VKKASERERDVFESNKSEQELLKKKEEEEEE